MAAHSVPPALALASLASIPRTRRPYPGCSTCPAEHPPHTANVKRCDLPSVRFQATEFLDEEPLIPFQTRARPGIKVFDPQRPQIGQPLPV